MEEIVRRGQRYRCQNPKCQTEIEVTKDSSAGESNPRCFCGAEMKKAFTAPVLRTLDKDASALADLFPSRGHARDSKSSAARTNPRTTRMLRPLGLSSACISLLIGVILLYSPVSRADTSQTVQILAGATFVSFGLVTIPLVVKDWVDRRRHYKNADTGVEVEPDERSQIAK